ncbi:MAG: PA2778 family cysteine peptidase [Burkholderiaceae bacterium]
MTRLRTSGAQCLTPAAAGVLFYTAAMRCAAVVMMMLWLAGCATRMPQTVALQTTWPADVPQQAQITSVPFIAQDDYQCGPAALAMVAQHAGVPQSLATWVQQVYVPARQGSLQSEMLAASRRNGLVAYPLAPRLDALLREVAAGHPVLVLQNLAFAFSPVWHYAVVIGFDAAQGSVTLHSGRTENLHMPLTTFERTWARAEHWAMLALPPQRLAATAQADAYVAAVVALERVQPGAAQTAYATALKAWPTHRIALLGAGNSAYTLGQKEAAVQAYRAAAQAYPQDGDAWNNLAQVLMEQGQYGAALQAVQRAVAIGGSRLAQYRALEQSIQSKVQSSP